MNAEQKAKAIACLEQVKRIGHGSAFSLSGSPCCSLGHLLACVAGVSGIEAAAREKAANGSAHEYTRHFPEIKMVLGLDVYDVAEITSRNDSNSDSKSRRRAVLSYLKSVETS